MIRNPKWSVTLAAVFATSCWVAQRSEQRIKHASHQDCPAQIDASVGSPAKRDEATQLKVLTRRARVDLLNADESTAEIIEKGPTLLALENRSNQGWLSITGRRGQIRPADALVVSTDVGFKHCDGVAKATVSTQSSKQASLAGAKQLCERLQLEAIPIVSFDRGVGAIIPVLLPHKKSAEPIVQTTETSSELVARTLMVFAIVDDKVPEQETRAQRALDELCKPSSSRRKVNCIGSIVRLSRVKQKGCKIRLDVVNQQSGRVRTKRSTCKPPPNEVPEVISFRPTDIVDKLMPKATQRAALHRFVFLVDSRKWITTEDQTAFKKLHKKYLNILKLVARGPDPEATESKLPDKWYRLHKVLTYFNSAVETLAHYANKQWVQTTISGDRERLASRIRTAANVHLQPTDIDPLLVGTVTIKLTPTYPRLHRRVQVTPFVTLNDAFGALITAKLRHNLRFDEVVQAVKTAFGKPDMDRNASWAEVLLGETPRPNHINGGNTMLDLSLQQLEVNDSWLERDFSDRLERAAKRYAECAKNTGADGFVWVDDLDCRL